MTVAASTNRSGPYAGAGLTGPYTVGFPFLDSSHLLVVRTDSLAVETTLVLGVDYTVTGAGNPTGGTLTLAVALAVGLSLTIQRNVPLTQLLDYTQSDAFPAESHESGLDKLTMISQQARADINSSIRVPEVAGVPLLPSAASRAGMALAFDALGNPALVIAQAGTFTYGQAVIDRYTGDGVTTAFLLSSNPGLQSNIMVDISGVVQDNSVDYTWISGTTITFTTAPPLATAVRVRYIRTLPQGTSDAGSTAFNPAASYSASMVGSFLTSIYGRTAAEIAAAVTVTNYFYKPGHAYRYGTNTTPGTTDMTTALAATLLQAYVGGADPFWPGQTQLLSTLTATAAVKIDTEGFATLLKQKSGLASDTHILNVQASGFEIGDFSAIGNIASDTLEFMHVAVIGGGSTISGVKFGRIKATNIRGDVLYVGGSIAAPVYNVKTGDISGTNIYRNVVSFVGVNGCEVDSISGTQIGYRLFDVEPNAGVSQAPTGIRIKHVRGATINFGGDPTINIGNVQIDYLELDNSLLADSVPGYPTHPPSAGNIGIIHGNVSSLRIGHLKARGYLERLFNSNANTVKGSVVVDSVDISGCNTTEAVFKTLFNIDEKIDLRLNTGPIALAGFDRYIVKGNAGPFALNDLRISGGAVATKNTNGQFTNLTIDASGLASNLFGDCISCTFENVAMVNAAAATFIINSANNTLDTVTGTLAVVEGSGCADNQARNSQLSNIWYAYDRLGGHVTSQAMADANQTLAPTKTVVNSITTTGVLTAQRNLVVPTLPRIYKVFNNCTGFGVQVIGASGTGVVIGVGKKAEVQFDGTNVVRWTADI